MAKQVEADRGDDAAFTLIDLCAECRDVAGDQAAGQDNIAPVVAEAATAVHATAEGTGLIARHGAVDQTHNAARVEYATAFSDGRVARHGAVRQVHTALEAANPAGREGLIA